MTISAFGVDDYRIAKADGEKKRSVAGAAAAGATAGLGLGAAQQHVYREGSWKGIGARTSALGARGLKALKGNKTAAIFTAGGAGLAAVDPAMHNHYQKKKDAVAKALTDSPKARRAQERKKAGLGVAGVGYLTATRAKDVSPHGAAMITRSAKKIGEEEHAARVARKVKIMDKVTGRGGAALVAGGVGLATEGYINNLRARGKLDRKKTFGKADTSSAFFGKAASSEDPADKVARLRGEAAVHSDKADKANKRSRAGLGAAFVGGAGSTLVTPKLRRVEAAATNKAVKLHNATVARGIEPSAAQISTARRAGQVARGAARARKVATFGGAGLAIGGINTAAVYAGKRRKQAKQDATKRGTATRIERRQAAVGKAFDSERQRHRRAASYEGAATGGAVVAGAGAGVLARKSKQVKLRSQAHTNLAQRGRFDTETKLHQMGQEKGTPVTRANMTAAASKLRRAAGHDEAAAVAGRAARKLGHGAIGTAAGAGALAATAFGIHRSDRKGSGTSYPY